MPNNIKHPPHPPQWLEMPMSNPQTLGELLPDLIAKYQLTEFRSGEVLRPRRERLEAGAA